MRVVVDTNVVVSGVLRPASKPGRILDLMLDGRLDVVSSTELIAEYREVLARPRFGFDAGLVNALVDEIEAVAEDVVPEVQLDVTSADPKDQFVIDLALAVDAYIVTGNVRHFLRYPKTVSPAELVVLLARGGREAAVTTFDVGQSRHTAEPPKDSDA